ncbi:MAG: hypothetical protein K8F91_23500 [Candidatus Obscuribacterales bacterium]|nr:hypothetical protein [Candidatus Obscuribacterales bacterium]
MSAFEQLSLFWVFTFVTLILSTVLIRYLLDRAGGIQLFKKSVNVDYWGAYHQDNQRSSKTSAIALPQTFATDHTVSGSQAYSNGGF